MSNTLYINVGEFKRFDQPNDATVVVLASDSYGSDFLSFDDVDHFKECYPTEDDLVRAVLDMPVFAGSAVFARDGSYTLDAVSSVVVEGYPE